MCIRDSFGPVRRQGPAGPAGDSGRSPFPPLRPDLSPAVPSWPPHPGCGGPRGDPGSVNPTCATTLGHRAPDRSRRGTAGCTGSGLSGHTKGRTCHGPATVGRLGRDASRSGTAGMPAEPGSSRCPGGRCRLSRPRQRRAAVLCRRLAHPPRSIRRGWRSAQPATRRGSCSWCLGQGQWRSGRSRIEPISISTGLVSSSRRAPAPIDARLQVLQTGAPSRSARTRSTPHPKDAVTALEPRLDRLSTGSDPVLTGSDPALTGSGGPSWRRTAGNYVALTKPRIIELLLVTTFPTMFLAQRGLPPLWLIVATLVGGTLSAALANVLNCYLDRDIDKVMHRTQNRPLVTGAIAPGAALRFGAVLGLASTLWLGLLVNWLSAVLSLGAIALYVGFYTMLLKRRTSQNIVWGGAALRRVVPP